MKNTRFLKWFSIICAVIGCLVLINLSLYLAYLLPNDSSQVTAAWFQAVGSVVAIIVAIVIAAYQTNSSRKETERSQALADEIRRKGVLAVAAAANNHAERIGEAMSQNNPFSSLFDVYDHSIINGMVAALTAAPIYDIGDAKAVAALIHMRDQFVFLGQAVESFIAGPLKYGRAIHNPIKEITHKNLAQNAKDRADSIQSAFQEIRNALQCTS